MCVNIFSNYFIRTFILKAMNITSQIIIDFLYLQLSHKVKTLLYHVNVIKIDIKQTLPWLEKDIKFSNNF